MRAEQFGQDFHLFFDRRIAELGAPNYCIGPSEPALEKGRPLRIGTEILDFEGNSLGKKAFVLTQANLGENGAEASLSEEGDLSVKLGDFAYHHLDIYNELVIPLPRDGKVRIVYTPRYSG